MACFQPWSQKNPTSGLYRKLPCGRCTGCKLAYSRQWAVRCMHEASLHEHNSFVTLTYSDQYLPRDFNLDREAFPLFMKRLRKRMPGTRVRYFHCGEYGGEFLRPHYHALLFGVDFHETRYPWMMRGENQIWRSPFLESLWPQGLSEIGAVTAASVSYVTRYVIKKVTGSQAREHYERVAMDTGECLPVVPEYVTMSRGRGSDKGIGYRWFQKFESEVFPRDGVLFDGQIAKPPRYYDGMYKLRDPEGHEAVAAARRGKRNRDDETAERLQVRAVCAEARLNLFKRDGV